MHISLTSHVSRILLIGFLSILAFVSLSGTASAQWDVSCSAVQFIDGGSVGSQIDDCAHYNSLPSCPAEGTCLEYIQYGYPNSNECQVYGRQCSSTACGPGFTGTYPECNPIPTCEAGMVGTYPYCSWPPTCADYGQQGTYPNCYTPPKPTCEDYGMIGGYPNCYYPPAPTCADYGQLGTYPNCYYPPAPTCADYGQIGTYPNCYYPPPPPTCADYGQWGTYPSCYTPTCQELGNCPVPPPTCADYGQQGTYPNCSYPPTCADYGQQGNYPYCYAYPTCADYGQAGDYPNCYNACVGNVGQGCNSGANACGETNYGSVNCDGSCSAQTPSDSSCPYTGQEISCYPSSGSTADAGSVVSWVADITGFNGSPTITWNEPYGSPSYDSGTWKTSFATTYQAGGQYSPTVSVYDWTGSVTTACVPVTVGATCPSGMDLTLTATPVRVRSGQSSTISYDFTNVVSGTSCTLTENGAVIASRASNSCALTSGSIARTISMQSTYVLQCGGSSEELIVNVVPNFTEF